MEVAGVDFIDGLAIFLRHIKKMNKALSNNIEKCRLLPDYNFTL